MKGSSFERHVFDKKATPKNCSNAADLGSLTLSPLEMNPPTTLKRYHWLIALVAYTLAVLLVHRQVVADLGARVIGGHLVGGVFIWEFSWFKKSFFDLTHLNPFFTKDLMFPVGTPLIIESPLLIGLSLVGQSIFDPYRIYNLLFFLSYIGAGVSMYFLAFYLTKNGLASFLSGFLFMFSHYNLTQHALGHLHESMILFVPLTFMGLIDFWMNRSKMGLKLFIVGAIGSCLSSTYIAFESLIVGVPAFLIFSWMKTDVEHKKRKLGQIFIVYLGVGLVGLLSYWPVFVHRTDLIGGSDSYSLSILSYFDYPAWHPNEAVQALRGWTSGFTDRALLNSSAYVGRAAEAAKAAPENLLGFFGLTLFFLFIVGIRLKSFRNQGCWIVLGMVGLVMSLGPDLQFSYSQSGFPLPYIAFSKLPVFEMFRVPSRMILLTWLGVSVLSGVVFSRIDSLLKRSWTKLILLVVIIGAFSWEMGVMATGDMFATVHNGLIYQRLKSDPVPGAVLELPVAINRSTGVSLNAEKFMLYQPLHNRPLVVGRPARYSEASLSFCNGTDFVYELTHPITISQLYSMTDRFQQLKSTGRDILKENGIRFVLFHRKDRFFSDKTNSLYERLLVDVLGPPVLIDENDMALFEL